LASIEQLCLDGGDWLLANEILLEDEPPLPSFEKHSARGISEAPTSELLEPRVAVVHMTRLKAIDDMTERRRRLAKGRSKGKDKTGLDHAATDGAAGDGKLATTGKTVVKGDQHQSKH